MNEMNTYFQGWLRQSDCCLLPYRVVMIRLKRNIQFIFFARLTNSVIFFTNLCFLKGKFKWERLKLGSFTACSRHRSVTQVSFHIWHMRTELKELNPRLLSPFFHSLTFSFFFLFGRKPRSEARFTSKKSARKRRRRGGEGGGNSLFFVP